MARDIRARFSKGKIEPLEDLDLKEGTEIVISIKEVTTEDEWPAWKRELEQAAKEAGFTTEEQINELIYEQRHRNT